MSSIDKAKGSGCYDPRAVELLDFAAAAAAFRSGADTPRAYLERCIQRIEAHDGAVRAFVTLNLDGARRCADASTQRYREGRPLSPVDGMPVGIKDIFETEDMPTQKGSVFHAGDMTGRDAAHVYALRKGGALIVGKTVTTEFAMARPGPTRNPFGYERTPGGSSSGTAAAVAARMIAAGTGSHARGSVIRPASYCGNYAIKPTFGAINRGGCTDVFKSQDHIGVHAGTLADMWSVAKYLSEIAGGDPGYPGLFGGKEIPAPQAPRRLGVLRMRGWELTDQESRDAFDGFVEWLCERGVEVVVREKSAALEEYEQALLGATDLWAAFSTYEMRWPMQVYRDRDPAKLAPWIVDAVARAETMTLEDYRHVLRQREELRRLHEALEPEVDCYITLSSPGPAPEGMGVGDAVFNEPSSMLGAPAINVPLFAVGGFPLGLQLLGFQHRDESLCAIARWMENEHRKS